MDRINLFYEGNDDLVGVLATSIASVCTNTKSQLLINILDTGISECNKRHLLSLCERYSNASLVFSHVDLQIFEGLKGYIWIVIQDC